MKTGRGTLAVGECGSARTRERGHGTVRCDLADAMIARVSDDHVALAVHRHAIRIIKTGRGTLAVGECGSARTGERGHGTVRCDLADAMIAPVSDDHVALAVHRHAIRIVKPGR